MSRGADANLQHFTIQRSVDTSFDAGLRWRGRTLRDALQRQHRETWGTAAVSGREACVAAIYTHLDATVTSCIVSAGFDLCQAVVCQALCDIDVRLGHIDVRRRSINQYRTRQKSQCANVAQGLRATTPHIL